MTETVEIEPCGSNCCQILLPTSTSIVLASFPVRGASDYRVDDGGAGEDEARATCDRHGGLAQQPLEVAHRLRTGHHAVASGRAQSELGAQAVDLSLAVPIYPPRTGRRRATARSRTP